MNEGRPKNPHEMPTLEELREKIDALDTTLITALSERMALVPLVAEYKKANGIQRYQPAREAEVIASRRALAEKLSVNPDLAEDILKRIIQDAHRIEEGIMGN